MTLALKMNVQLKRLSKTFIVLKNEIWSTLLNGLKKRIVLVHKEGGITPSSIPTYKNQFYILRNTIYEFRFYSIVAFIRKE
jgi:hypothetical protein